MSEYTTYSLEPSRQLRVAIAGDREALKTLWDGRYSGIRDRIRRMPASGRPGSTLEATAVANEIYGLQQHHGLRHSDVSWAFSAIGVDQAQFCAGMVELEPSQVDRAMLLIIGSHARSYIHDYRQRKRPSIPLDAAGEHPSSDTGGHTTMMEWMDYLAGLDLLASWADKRPFLIALLHDALEFTYEEIGPLLGISRQRACQLKALADHVIRSGQLPGGGEDGTL